jgi:hypothetical protein
MKRFVIPLALSLLVVAVPTRGAQPTSMAASATPDEVKAQLVRYHWRLQDATTARGRRIQALFVRPDRPLQLDFDGKWFWIRNSCNFMSSDYTLDGEFLIEGNAGSQTVAACIPRIQALDEEIGKRIGGRVRYAFASGDTPVLALFDANGDKLVFIGTLIGERLSIEVAAHTKPCKPALAAETQCLQMREVKHDDSDGSFDAKGPFESFDGEIEGFKREEGMRYVLGVERFVVDGTRGSHPRERYVLEWVSVSDATGK